MLAAAALVLVAAACSSSGGSSAPTTLAPTTAVPPTTVVPPKVTQTPVTAKGGKVVGSFTAVDGTGAGITPLPAGVGSTAIVHATYNGIDTFVVRAVDAQGRQLAVLAHSRGSYDGTFAVGFVNRKGTPVAGLEVDTTGPWHLDIAKPTLAPELTGSGVSGQGDAVLVYRGPGVKAHITYPGTSGFAIATYAHGAVTMLVSTVGPYHADIQLPAGPAFISVTAAGVWSMTLG